MCADDGDDDARVIVGGGDFFSRANLDFWRCVTQGEGLER